jgi:DNA/RNA endonuclease G (NUC1)
MRAFLIPNKFFPEEILIDEFSVSVDDLEQLTNFDFFSYLPDNLEIKLEASK